MQHASSQALSNRLPWSTLLTLTAVIALISLHTTSAMPISVVLPLLATIFIGIGSLSVKGLDGWLLTGLSGACFVDLLSWGLTFHPTVLLACFGACLVLACRWAHREVAVTVRLGEPAGQGLVPVRVNVSSSRGQRVRALRLELASGDYRSTHRLPGRRLDSGESYDEVALLELPDAVGQLYVRAIAELDFGSTSSSKVERLVPGAEGGYELDSAYSEGQGSDFTDSADQGCYDYY